jgi:hypothetical protein
MTMPPVTEIEANRIPREKPSHHLGKSYLSGPQQEMGVIGKQCPSVTGGSALRKEISQALNEILAVLLIPKDIQPLYAADDHMVYDTGRIQSG